jgi:hypothetical protein
MMDFASGVSLTKDTFQFLNFLKGIVGSDVISAYFRYDATKVEGSSKIEVELIKTETDEVFWFTVTPIEDYIFIRFPLNDSGCEERIGTVKDEILPNPNYWRWVQAARSGTIVDGSHEPANAKVDFVVVGYKPKAIIKHLSSNA